MRYNPSGRWMVVRRQRRTSEDSTPEFWDGQGWGQFEGVKFYRDRKQARYALAYGRSRRVGFENACIRNADNPNAPVGPGKFKYTLTPEIITFIRQAQAAPTLKELARHYGLSQKHVHNIARGTCYKYIKVPKTDWRKDAPPPMPSPHSAEDAETTG